VELVRQKEAPDWQVVRMTEPYSEAMRGFPMATRIIRHDANDGAPFPLVQSTYDQWRIPTVKPPGPLPDPFETEFCPRCRAAHDEWVASHPDVASILIRRVTLEDYTRQAFPSPGDRSAVGRWLDDRRADVVAGRFVGDELWEWNGGHEPGDDVGFGGLAAVREGRIVKVWVDRDHEGNFTPGSPSADAPPEDSVES
jgi:hypothetical protein